MSDTVTFASKLQQYKQLIDADIEAYVAGIQVATREQYGEHAHTPVDAYLQILQRGGKRMRGALVCLGYEMSGGTNQEMIIEAARAIELFHAHMLVVDDIQDRSATRRGGPTAHKLLETHHLTSQFIGDAEHYGRAVAINGALAGLHSAETILAKLDAPAELRLKALELVNKTLLITVHGQSHDIANELISDVRVADVDRVMEWKTATYSILNPLQIGMVLAGATDADLAAITPYAMHVGKAFQITDDVIGTFGEQKDIHKNPMDDMREGKRTLLVVHALNHAVSDDRQYLLEHLGLETLGQEEFEQCKLVLERSGALDYANERAAVHVDEALSSLQIESKRWSRGGIEFLHGLAEYILSRKS